MLFTKGEKLTKCSIVFTFQTDVISGDAKRDFSARTDMERDDFRSRVHAYLDGPDKSIQLAYKISGDTGKPSHMNNNHDFTAAMTRLTDKARHARSRAVCLEIKNIVCVRRFLSQL